MESNELPTKGDKAREAARVGIKLKSLGVSHQDAADAAHHELQHALADKKPGTLGIDIDVQKREATAHYSPIGTRSAEEELEYTQAATDKPSESDKKRIEELKKEIANRKKGFFAKLFRR